MVKKSTVQGMSAALNALFAGIQAHKTRERQEAYDERAVDAAARADRGEQARIQKVEQDDLYDRLVGRPGQVASAMGLSGGAREHLLSAIAKSQGDYEAANMQFQTKLPEMKQAILGGGGEVPKIALGGGGGGQSKDIDERLKDLEGASKALGSLWELDKQMRAARQPQQPMGAPGGQPGMAQPPGEGLSSGMQSQIDNMMRAMQEAQQGSGNPRMQRRSLSTQVPLGTGHTPATR